MSGGGSLERRQAAVPLLPNVHHLLTDDVDRKAPDDGYVQPRCQLMAWMSDRDRWHCD
jgi:hypothetical protein